MRKYDVISTSFLAALGLYVVITGVKLGFGDWHEPGPGFIAVLSGLLLFILSGAWFVLTLPKKRGGQPEKLFFKRPDSGKKVLTTFLALVTFALVLDRLGFILSCFLLMIFLLKAVEPQRWKLTILMAVSVTVFCILVFQLWLQVQFPEGPLNIYKLKKWIF